MGNLLRETKLKKISWKKRKQKRVIKFQTRVPFESQYFVNYANEGFNEVPQRSVILYFIIGIG